MICVGWVDRAADVLPNAAAEVVRTGRTALFADRAPGPVRTANIRPARIGRTRVPVVAVFRCVVAAPIAAVDGACVAVVAGDAAARIARPATRV